MNPSDFHTSLETGDTLILEKNSTKSIAFITSISAGEEARIGPGSRAPPATGPTSSRLCRVVEKGTVGLPRQPVGKWRSSPTTGARGDHLLRHRRGRRHHRQARRHRRGRGRRGGNRDADIRVLSSYPAGAGADVDAADAGAGDAEAYAALRALRNATSGFSASDAADEAGEEELDLFRDELYKAQELRDLPPPADRKERLVAANEVVTAALARAGADAALRPRRARAAAAHGRFGTHHQDGWHPGHEVPQQRENRGRRPGTDRHGDAGARRPGARAPARRRRRARLPPLRRRCAQRARETSLSTQPDASLRVLANRCTSPSRRGGVAGAGR